MLHAIVPNVEGEPDGPEPEANDRQPLPRARRRDCGLEQNVAKRRERRRRKTEAGDRLGSDLFQAARKDRIGRPDNGARQREPVAKENTRRGCREV